jgi:hypothetical protein
MTLRWRYAALIRQLTARKGTSASRMCVVHQEWKNVARTGVIIQKPIFAAREREIMHGHVWLRMSAAIFLGVALIPRPRYAVRGARVLKETHAAQRSVALRLPLAAKMDTVLPRRRFRYRYLYQSHLFQSPP